MFSSGIVPGLTLEETAIDQIISSVDIMSRLINRNILKELLPATRYQLTVEKDSNGRGRISYKKHQQKKL